MKHYFILLSLLLGLVACQDSPDSLLPKDFHVTVNRIQAQRAYIEVFPVNEFTYYSLELVPVDTFQAHYSSDEDYIRQRDDSLKSIAKRYLDNDIKPLLWCGTTRQTRVLSSNTDYYMLIYSYSDRTPIVSLRKDRFSTLQRRTTGFAIDSVVVDTTDIVVYPTFPPGVEPSTYFWDFATTNEINRHAYGLHSYYFYNYIDNYYQLDFMPELLSRGIDRDSWKKYYTEAEFQVGDTMKIMAVGYDSVTGETTNQYDVWFFVRPMNDSTHVKAFQAEPDGLESIFMPTSELISSSKRMPSCTLPIRISSHRRRSPS